MGDKRMRKDEEEEHTEGLAALTPAAAATTGVLRVTSGADNEGALACVFGFRFPAAPVLDRF